MEITVSQSYELPDLAVRWMELESRADGGFFLSWRWIGSWLRTTGANPLLVTAKQEGRVIALGLVARARRKRLFFTVHQLCLHETGVAECDAVMIEHNNFLVAKDAPPGLMADLLRALQKGAPSWDEIVLGGISDNVLADIQAAGLTAVTDRLSPDFGVALSHQAPSGRWEETLSPNLRA